MKRVLTRTRHPGADEASLALAKEAAVQLLERSIQFGHGRLSVLRLAMAVQAGAHIPHEHWDYCRQIASSSQDVEILNLFKEASQVESSPPEFSLPVPTVPRSGGSFHKSFTKVNHEIP